MVGAQLESAAQLMIHKLCFQTPACGCRSSTHGSAESTRIKGRHDHKHHYDWDTDLFAVGRWVSRFPRRNPQSLCRGNAVADTYSVVASFRATCTMRPPFVQQRRLQKHRTTTLHTLSYATFKLMQNQHRMLTPLCCVFGRLGVTAKNSQADCHSEKHKHYIFIFCLSGTCNSLCTPLEKRCRL